MMSDLIRSSIASLLPLDRVHNGLFIGGIFAVYGIAFICWWFYRTTPPLTRVYASFPIIARRVVNAGERPVIFLTLRVSTASLPTGAHVRIRASIGGEGVVRSYTPTRFNAGECELMFRVYEGGPMTNYLASLKVGDVVAMQGPTGLERYAPAGPGTFSRAERVWKGITHVALVSGGTGITPMLQIANHVLQDAADKTKLSLVSFTTTVNDIMLGDELRALAEASRGALRLKFVASNASPAQIRGAPDVHQSSMRLLTSDSLRELLGVPGGPTTMVCICGPDGFVTRAKELLQPNFVNVLVW